MNVVHVAHRRAAKQEDILGAAAELIAEEGYDAFTMQALAKRLGHAAGAVYRYFAGKEAVLAAIQARIIADLERATLETATACVKAAGGASPEARALLPLLGAGALYTSLEGTEDFRLLCLMLGDPRRLVDDTNAEPVVARAMVLLGHLAGLFQLAADARALRPGDPNDRAIVFWASLHGVVQLGKVARLRPEVLSPARLEPVLVSGLLAGWGAPAAALAEAEEIMTTVEVKR